MCQVNRACESEGVGCSLALVLCRHLHVKKILRAVQFAKVFYARTSHANISNVKISQCKVTRHFL